MNASLDPPERRGVDPGAMGRINAVETLRALYRGGAMTLSQLTAATGFARRTAEVAVDRLTRHGLVAELGVRAELRALGRPAKSFAFRADAGVIVGIDVGVLQTRVSITDLAGTIVGTRTVAVLRGAERAERLASIVTAVDQCLMGASVGREQIWTMAVGTPGLVTDERVVTLCQVLPDWSGLDLAEILGSEFGCPVAVGNDTNMAAIGEQWRGIASGIEDLLWVLVGRRSRAAMTVAGRLTNGVDGAAGEIGWLPALGWSALSNHPLSYLGSSDTRAAGTADSILHSARAGQHAAQETIREYAEILAPGLSALVLVVNPAMMVLGGVAQAIGDPLVTGLLQSPKFVTLRPPQVRLSTLGYDAGMLGAVKHALTMAEARLFDPAQLV